MESKPKKRQVRKVRSVTREQHVPPKQSAADKPSAEALILQNGRLVEALYRSEVWSQILKPVLDELVAGVSGRCTDGRFYHGTLTRDWSNNTSVFLAGFQKALMDYSNSINDFVLAKNKLIAQQKAEASAVKQPMIGPLMEDEDE